MDINDYFREFATLPASAVFEWLRCIEKAKVLSTSAEAQFESEADGLEEGALEMLQRLSFAEVHHEFSKRINAYLGLRTAHGETLEYAPEVERRLKTLDVQVRHATEKRSRPRLLKSKSAQWEEASQQGSLEKQREDLLRIRAASRAAKEQAQKAHESLHFELSRSPDAQSYRWLSGQASRLTAHGQFLLSVMKQMEPRHFQGRQLGDLLAIGFLLA